MNLLIDLGNSRLKWAQHAPDTWRTDGVPLNNAAIETIAESAWAGLPRPQHALLCSVSTEARTRALQDWLRARWSVEARLVRAESKQLGVRNGYRRPDQLGPDRWVAMIGARGMTERPVCVVDAGTAVTLDALSARGEYIGGAIFPGLGLLRASLAQGTAAIRADAGNPADSLGRSTEDGVAAGTLYGLAGAIDRLIEEHRRTLGQAMEVYLTGGDAPLLAPRLSAVSTSVPDLVLRGLARIADAL